MTNPNRLQANMATARSKKESKDFDVFLCHNEKDKPEVKRIGEQLKVHGLSPWLDEWEQRPGFPWQRLLEAQIGQIKSAAVFVGKSGIDPWSELQIDAFLREFVKRGCPVIPVLLSDAPQKPQLPLFLSGMAWVDFRQQDPDPMDQLIYGITGEHKKQPVPVEQPPLPVRRLLILAGEFGLTVILPIVSCIIAGYFLEAIIPFNGFFSGLGTLIGIIVGMAGVWRFISRHLHYGR